MNNNNKKTVEEKNQHFFAYGLYDNILLVRKLKKVW